MHLCIYSLKTLRLLIHNYQEIYIQIYQEIYIQIYICPSM